MASEGALGCLLGSVVCSGGAARRGAAETKASGDKRFTRGLCSAPAECARTARFHCGFGTRIDRNTSDILGDGEKQKRNDRKTMIPESGADPKAKNSKHKWYQATKWVGSALP